MSELLRNLAAAGNCARKTLGAMVLAAALVSGGEVQAQGGLFASSSAACDAFCVGGRQVTVERFEPSGLAHAFCASRPALILLHGADGLAESGPLYREAACNLAKAGYATYIVHYFDSTPDVASRGQVDPGSVKGPRFLTWQATVSAAVCWVAQQPGVDPRRIGLLGFSLGSYLSLAEAARNPQVALVVDFFGGLPAEAVRMVRHLPPTLIVHGEADPVVPLGEALRLRNVLARLGVPHQMAIYPGAGHELKGRDKEDAAARVLQFLRCYL